MIYIYADTDMESIASAKKTVANKFYKTTARSINANKRNFLK